MIGAVRFHLYDVLSKRSRLVLGGFSILVGLIFLALTRLNMSATERLLSGTSFSDDYLFEGLIIIKTIALMLVAFCGIRLWFYAAGDLVLVQRIGKIQLTLSKAVASWLIVWIMMTFYIFLYWSIGTWFGVSFYRFSLWSLWWRTSVFVMYYVGLSGALAVMLQHVFSQLGMVFGWFMADVLVDMGFDVSTTTLPALLMNAVFINIHVNQDWQLTMLLHGVYIIGITIAWFMLTIAHVMHRDF